MTMRSKAESTAMPRGRRAGVCLHLTSLPGPYGIGEIGAAAVDLEDRAGDLDGVGAR